MRKTIVLMLLSISLSSFSAAQAESETFVFSGLKASDIEEGTRQYLVYMVEKETGDKKWLSLWERTTRLIEHDGETVIETSQLWSSDDNRFQRKLYSLNRLDNFAPIFHWVKSSKEDAPSAYKFAQDKVFGDPDVANNKQAGFEMAKQAETMNWELDIETLALLPLGEGKSFYINFYHPGANLPPQPYEYKVVGSETLHDLTGHDIPTWMLQFEFGDGSGRTSHTVFWLEKSTGQLVKMAEEFGGFTRYKVRLGVVSGDTDTAEAVKQEMAKN